MAITTRTPTVVYGTTTSTTVVPHSSVVTGDIMVVAVLMLSSVGAPATPSGWTLRTSGTLGTRAFYIWHRARADGDGSYTFTWPAAGATTTVLVPVAGASSIVSSGTVKLRATSPAETVTSTAPSKTTTGDGMVLGFMFEATTTAEATKPTLAGGTEVIYAAQSGTTNIETIMIGSKATAANVAPDAMVTTYPNTQASNGAGVMLAFGLAPSSGTVSLAGTLWDGSALVDGYYKWWDGAALLELESVTPVYPGLKVDRFFAPGTGILKVAHRMGSLNYREMSMRGATQSAVAGAGALEFSVGRTSDGVYFGLHDDTLNRTTPSLAANYRPGDHTWAEISQLVQTAPTTNDTRYGDQPYQRLADVLAVYGGTHAFFIDPKVIGSGYWDEMLDYLATFPDAQNTFVIKYFHTAVALADKARARGFKTWGYAYQTDVDGTAATQLADTASRWDYLGMDYQANIAAWSTTRQLAMNFGKKIIGHICPSIAAAQTCVDRGAVGVMCSGINEVAGWGLPT